MTTRDTDIVIIGAGPVGLMCAYLAQLCGLHTVILDRSAEPLKVGKADALNARTLQLLEVAGLFEELYPLGKICNTSSVWANGKFISRESSWWEELEGCLHKHFLMLGQSFVEQLLDAKLLAAGTTIKRLTEVVDVRVVDDGCITILENKDMIRSRYVIGADGSQSLVRKLFNVSFQITRPEIVWAVIDGIIDTDFPKVPEIIVFQAETSDVAWIPREGQIDRFYVRMDTKNFTAEEAIAKINRALHPHTLSFKEIVWYSKFSVKESVAERFFIQDRIFLAGDACHIHSVNGGQGLNTGLGDAFNLIWKLNMVINFGASTELLKTYEDERKPVALSVVETSGKLVRSTKYSQHGTHAQDYVKIVQQHAGNITGMGVRYTPTGTGIIGTRLFDFEVYDGFNKNDSNKIRVYSLLDYAKWTLLVFGEQEIDFNPPSYVNIIKIYPHRQEHNYWSESIPYLDKIMLVRPDAVIAPIVVG